MSRPWMLNFLKRWATASRPTSSGMPLKSHATAAVINQPTNRRSTATIHIILREPAPPVKNWRILLVQSFIARMPLLTATSAFGFRRRCWSSCQRCYLCCLRTLLQAAAVLTARGRWIDAATYWIRLWIPNTHHIFPILHNGPRDASKNGASSGGPGSSPVTRFLNSTLTWLTEWWF